MFILRLLDKELSPTPFQNLRLTPRVVSDLVTAILHQFDWAYFNQNDLRFNLRANSMQNFLSETNSVLMSVAMTFIIIFSLQLKLGWTTQYISGQPLQNSNIADSPLKEKS